MLGIERKPSQFTQKHVYGYKSEIIPITKSEIISKNSLDKGINNEMVQHSLNENYFDPSKMSPPNDFMNKLQKRLGTYYDN